MTRSLTSALFPRSIWIFAVVLLSAGWECICQAQLPAAPGSRVADQIIFPQCQFNGASMAEAIEFFSVKSRDIDPARKGVNFVVGNAVRNSPVKISLDFKNTPLSEILDVVAHIARLDVSYDQNDVTLTPSSTRKPPYPKGTPTAEQQAQGKVILKKMEFSQASLGECLEFIRVITERDAQPLQIPRLKIIVDPALDTAKLKITTNMAQVPVADALDYLAEMMDAEFIYLGQCYYLQPDLQPRSKLAAGTLPDLGDSGKVVLPQMQFAGATIDEAIEFITVKSRDLDPQKKGICVLMDDATRSLKSAITLDSRDITCDRAILQVATVAGVDLYQLHDAVRLRSPLPSSDTSASASAPAAVMPSPAPAPASAPDFRTFTNTRGQTIRAKLVRVQADDVILQRDDGKEYILKISTLSAEDIQHLKQQGAAIP